MSEQFAFSAGGRGNESAELPHGLSQIGDRQESSLKEQPESVSMRLSREAHDDFHQTLAEAFQTLKPIFDSIAGLDAEMRKDFIQANLGMRGPAYDILRRHFA